MAKPKKQHFSSNTPPSKPTLPSFQSLLQMSQSSLQNRNFTCAHELALLAQQADPAHNAPPVLIAISSVLKAPPSDHYAILSLPPFTQNPALITTHFQNLKSLLNPTQNPAFPFASEAYGLVMDSWAVLSDLDRKMRYDQGFGRGGSFWTICPYCYHLFEYLKVYEGYCLRCQNGKCGKAFHGVALGEAPPEEVLEKGVYSCPGFVVLSGGNGEGEGKVWNPFGLLGSFPCGKKDEEKKGGEYVSIEISDDEGEEDKDEGKGNESFEANVGDMEVDCGVKLEEEGGIVGEKSVGEVEKEKGCGVVVCGKRIKKSVPMNSSKIMGKGVRVKRGEVLPMQGLKDLGCGGGDYMNNSLNLGGGTGGFEYNMGDDDILVMLQDVVVPTV